ncbi:hypothetical protein [Methanobrevibacter sp.]|uniref:hypothetical protein n=1 Tax=Methanobrevibacter sp. TaxID=66852 RepID=UPI00388E7EEA
MELLYIEILEVLLEIIVFLILMVVFKYTYNKLKNNPHRLLNPKEYFPEEELHSLIQISYLIMMGLFFINILYKIVFIRGDLFSFAIFDIILSLYLATRLDKSSLKNKFIVFLLIPFGSLTFLIFHKSLVGILDLIHVPVFIYFIKVYYDKFREYTESNSLGIAIILLFFLVFVSFFITQIAEGVEPLDSLVMVSNAFTSNGYTILGSTLIGKIDSVILVWGGYLLSSVGTATLTAGILIRHFNSRFEKLEEMIEENNKKE